LGKEKRKGGGRSESCGLMVCLLVGKEKKGKEREKKTPGPRAPATGGKEERKRGSSLPTSCSALEARKLKEGKGGAKKRRLSRDRRKGKGPPILAKKEKRAKTRVWRSDLGSFLGKKKGKKRGEVMRRSCVSKS